MIIDVHCHLESFKEINIPKNILPIQTGYSHKSNQESVKIAEKYNLPYVLGIAPQTAIFDGLDGLDEWTAFIKKHSPNAIGEIGLDLHWPKTEKHIQDEHILFNKMLDLAKEMNLPIVLHSRKAEREVFEIVKERNFSSFLMHCYSGDAELAKEIINNGGLISISPFHSKKKKQVINEIPLDYLTAETDAPYIGKTMDGIKNSLEYIATVKNITFDEVVIQTTKNAKAFFNIRWC